MRVHVATVIKHARNHRVDSCEMNVLVRILPGATVVLVVVASGCGGVAVANADGGTSPHEGSPDGRTPSDALCPANPPASGSACAILSYECEYGTSPSLACNTVYLCASNGWVEEPSAGCPTATCPGVAPTSISECPATSLVCSYGASACNCVLSPSGTGSPFWYCYSAPAGCPAMRPHLGKPCDDEGQSCTYGECYGVFLVCTGDRSWQVDTSATCF